mmetsp:Transcript_31402/g.80710  ORF Transcript_31402/g.80710 Transcript_31402/m.80710 type:complete len:263 (-) Transcript_31402:283-1071(-)
MATFGEGEECASLAAAEGGEVMEARAPSLFGRRTAVAGALLLGTALVSAAALVVTRHGSSAALAPAPPNTVQLYDSEAAPSNTYGHRACGDVACDCSWVSVPGSCANEALDGERCFSCCCSAQPAQQEPYHPEIQYHVDHVQQPYSVQQPYPDYSSEIVYHADHAHVPIYQDPMPVYRGDAYHGQEGHGDMYHGTYNTIPTTFVYRPHDHYQGSWWGANCWWWVFGVVLVALFAVAAFLFLRSNKPIAPPPPLYQSTRSTCG